MTGAGMGAAVKVGTHESQKWLPMGGWGGRRSEKAEGGGGALEPKSETPGVCLLGP